MEDLIFSYPVKTFWVIDTIFFSSNKDENIIRRWNVFPVSELTCGGMAYTLENDLVSQLSSFVLPNVEQWVCKAFSVVALLHVSLARLNYNSQNSLSCTFLAEVGLFCEICGGRGKVAAILELTHSCLSAGSLHWCRAADRVATAHYPRDPPSASLTPVPGKYLAPWWSLPSSPGGFPQHQGQRTDMVSVHPCGFQLILVGPSLSLLFSAVMDWIESLLKPPKEVLKSSSLVHQNVTFFGKWGLHRGNQIKKRLLGWTLIQYDWCCQVKGKFGRRDMHRGKTLWRNTRRMSCEGGGLK